MHKQEEARKAVNFKRAQSDLEDQDRAAEILKNNFQATDYQRTGQTLEQVNSDLSTKLASTGSQLLGYDTKTGLELLKQAGDAANKVSVSQWHQAETQKAQLSIANNLFNSVAPDGSDWDAIQVQLGKTGTVVPDQFKAWSPETQDRKSVV